MLKQPYPTVMKPYGRALVDLARKRPEILCLTGDLTRQTEIDLFQEQIPERFIHGGMAEANMISMAGALARRGFLPFVHTFGVFATRRPLDQIINSVAYPNLPVRIVGFMPGVSSPGGPSHQAIDDVALMRAIPNMTVVDLADATQIRAALPSIADIPGPVYLRLKRGEIPVIFEDDHEFSLTTAETLIEGTDLAVIASGMMLSSAVSAADTLAAARRQRVRGQRARDQALGRGLDHLGGERSVGGDHRREPQRDRRARVRRGGDDGRGRPLPFRCGASGCATPSPRGPARPRTSSGSTGSAPRTSSTPRGSCCAGKACRRRCRRPRPPKANTPRCEQPDIVVN